LLLGAIAASAVAQDWTRFRGPNGSGIGDAKTIPTKWTDSDFNWNVALPGGGHSSPVLWGDAIILTAADEKSGRLHVLCLSTTNGSISWQKSYPLTAFPKHDYNSFASSTAAVDAERIYLCRTEPERQVLFALDHKGGRVWEKDLGSFSAEHGGGASPIMHEGQVFLANEQDGESYLLAVDARTGETRWKSSHRSRIADYSTPCIYQPAGSPPVLIVNSQSRGITALTLDAGKTAWEFRQAFDKRSVSSPVIAGDLIIGSCGSGGGGNYVVAVRPGDPARNRPAERAYEIRRSASYVPTGICVGDWLYLWSEAGIVSRVRAATGEVQWQERADGNYFSSPVWVDGRLFNVTTAGEVVVVSASERFEVLARNPLRELTHSTIAVAGGRMYVRTSQRLFCVGGKSAEVRSVQP
jgi:outer membrane protein assembly factor BamB